MGGSSAQEAEPQPRREARIRRLVSGARGVPATIWIPLICGLVALGICCYQLSLPFVLLGIHGYTGNGYDDGVYLGAATRLVHGVLPYRDFDFLQPPGITIVMAPIALLGRVIGSRDAMAVARCVTALVTGVNAALVALVVRERGKVAMVVAGGSLALFPLAVAADQSLLLEPYLVFFCLLGVLALFSKGQLAGPRRVLLAGLALGFATSVKLWAVLPALAAVLCCVPSPRRALRPMVIGYVVGLGVSCLVFVVAAPHAFFHDVLSAQLQRGSSGVDDLSIAQRLVMISGLTGLPGITATTGLAVGSFVLFAVLVGVVYATTWRQRSRFDWFVLLATVVILAGMFSSPEFYDHYAYFPAAFLALLLGVCVAQLVSWARQLARSRVFEDRRSLLWAIPAVAVLGVVVLGVLLIEQDTSYASSYLSDSADPSAVLDAQIPEGACVVSDYAIFAINANRFDPAGTGCPAVVDPFGMWLSRNNGQPPPASPPYPPVFTAAWQGWFGSSDYVVLSVPYSNYVPWTSGLVSYFNKNFYLLSSGPRTYVYDHSNRPPSPGARSLIREGAASLSQRQFARSIADFQAALALDPADTDVEFDLGVVAQREGLRASAVAAYNRALFLDPRFTGAIYNLAVLDTTTSPQTAMSLYERVLRLKPGDADSEFNLGLLLVSSGQQSSGERLMGAAVATEPSLKSRVPEGITVP